jgi:diaminobutyrate-2-oxoglutarate transaminase
MVLLKPEHDVWEPGEHNGTFRGHNPAFVTAAEALAAYWSDDTLTREVERKASVASDALAAIAARHQESGAEVRGRGLILGLAFDDPEVAPAVSEACFERGLIVETSGPKSEVLKLLPPLTLSDEELEKGLGIIGESVDRVLSGTADPAAAGEPAAVAAAASGGGAR